jgi:prevent-host-death family protein
MRFITVTELRQRATQVISEIEATKEEVVITKNGKPVALIQYISNNAFALKESAHRKEVKHGKAKK